MKKLFVALLGSTLLISAAAFAETSISLKLPSGKTSYTVPATAPLSIQVDSDYASISVLEAKVPSIQVNVEYKGVQQADFALREKNGVLHVSFFIPSSQGTGKSLRIETKTVNGVTTEIVKEDGVIVSINGVAQGNGPTLSYSATQKIQILVPQKTLGHLNIENSSGDISVAGFSNKSKRSVFVKSNYGKVRGENLYGEKIHFEASGEAVTLTNITADLIEGVSTYQSVSSTQTTGELYLTSSSSNVSATSHKGQAGLKSTYGKVTASQFTGNIAAVSTSSDVEITNGEGDVIATSSYGNIRIENCKNGRLAGKTSSGNVEFNNPKAVSEQGVTTYGRVKYTGK